MVLHIPFRPSSLVSGAPEADVLVVPLVLQAPAMDNIYTSRKPLHVPLNIYFSVHAPLYACYAKPTVCECDPYAAKLNHLNKADEDKVLDIQTILVKYNIFHIDQ
uniref:Uncharacterized protein n=1 Tax=Oryza meridionalis TaxID=40149 RepID=A0A0E0EP82_9ORYZ